MLSQKAAKTVAPEENGLRNYLQQLFKQLMAWRQRPVEEGPASRPDGPVPSEPVGAGRWKRSRHRLRTTPPAPTSLALAVSSPDPAGAVPPGSAGVSPASSPPPAGDGCEAADPKSGSALPADDSVPPTCGKAPPCRRLGSKRNKKGSRGSCRARKGEAWRQVRAAARPGFRPAVSPLLARRTGLTKDPCRRKGCGPAVEKGVRCHGVRLQYIGSTCRL
jgi:hypothetical protein